MPPGLLSPKSYLSGMCLPKLKIWLSLYQFFAQLPTQQYTILCEKSTQCCPNWVFYNNLLKVRPISWIWAPLSPIVNPLIAIPSFAKKHIRGQAHVWIQCQCENPPPPPSSSPKPSWPSRSFFSIVWLNDWRYTIAQSFVEKVFVQLPLSSCSDSASHIC